MFRKKCLFLIFVVSFLGASDTQEKSVKNNNDTIKKIAALGIGLLGVIVSEKTAWLDVGDTQQLCYLGSCFDSWTITVLCVNFKYIPFVLVNRGMISLNNCKKAFNVISIFHGASAGLISYKALNRFFPSS